MAATTRGKRRHSESDDSSARQPSSSNQRSGKKKAALKPLSRKEQEMLLALQQRAGGTANLTPHKATQASTSADAVNEAAIQRKCEMLNAISSMLISMHIEARVLNQQMIESENQESDEEDDSNGTRLDQAPLNDDIPSPKRKRTNQTIVLNEDEVEITTQLAGGRSVAIANESEEEDQYGRGMDMADDDDDDMEENDIEGGVKKKGAYSTNGVRSANLHRISTHIILYSSIALFDHTASSE